MGSVAAFSEANKKAKIKTMNILIIGEFSAFAKHLKNGFKKLGHRVTIVHSGDSYKKIDSDEDDVLYEAKSIIINGNHILGSERLLSPWTNRIIQNSIEKRFKGVYIDVVIVIHYGFLTNNIFKPGVSLSYLKKLVNGGTKLIMTVCGNDPALHLAYPDFCKKIQLPRKKNNVCYEYLVEEADAIFPTTYSYFASIKNYCHHFGYDDSHICHTTPLPITVDDDYSITPCENRKIVIFHGITRPLIKGTPFIKDAMNRIQEEYPDKVECRCEGGMSYNEYVKLFERIDILIDQTYFNGWGMNAAIGAMKGKCVLAPCGKECREDIDIDDIPFIEIKPDADQIYSVLKHLVDNPEEIDMRKRASRKFVEQNCNSHLIAQRYIDVVFDNHINMKQ